MDVAQQAANNFTNYKIVMLPTYVRTRHLDLLDTALMEVVRYLETGEGIQRLIVELPPRSGKSLSVSELLPSWILGRRPDTNIVLVSYGASLAEMSSRRARDYVVSDKFQTIFPDTIPNDNIQRAGEWEVSSQDGERRGGMIAVGIGGSIVGKGAHLLIIDDPIKNRIEAESPSTRDTVWNSYTNDFLSRFNDSSRAAQIIIAQRYHTDDPTGRILRSPHAKTWKRLRLPALAEANDPLGRNVGEALWADRHSAEALNEIKERDLYSFLSQYQQAPISRGTTLFDATKVEIVTEIPEITSIVRFWDLAVTVKKRSDYTVGLKLGISSTEDIYILDIWRGKVKAPEMLGIIAKCAALDGYGVPIILEGEKAGIIQLDYLLSDSRLRGYAIQLQGIEGDKVVRASGISTRVLYGKMKIRSALWNYEFLAELAMFPHATHDDQVDALSGGYKYLTEHKETTFSVISLGVAH